MKDNHSRLKEMVKLLQRYFFPAQYED